MPFYRVLGGRWGEGWEPGQIVEIDTRAAEKRLEDGELEEVDEKEVKGAGELKGFTPKEDKTPGPAKEVRSTSKPKETKTDKK